MRYFQYLPQVDYEGTTATNITVRAKVRELIKKNAVLYYDYYVKDGDRPDTVAHKYYSSANYTWLVLYANDIFDVHEDWPRNYENFKAYIEDKYGSVYAANTTHHHYEDSDGNVIDEETYNTLSILYRTDVDCLAYETTLNDAKRTIRLIDEKYRDNLVTEIRRLFK